MDRWLVSYYSTVAAQQDRSTGSSTVKLRCSSTRVVLLGLHEGGVLAACGAAYVDSLRSWLPQVVAVLGCVLDTVWPTPNPHP